MAEPEIVKVELELPRDQIHIQPAAGQEAPKPAEQPAKSSPERIAEVKKELQKSKQPGEVSDGSKSAAENIAKALAHDPVENLPIVQDKTPPNSKQKVIIAAGLVVAILGLILWPLLNFVTGLIVAAVGGIIVAAGTFIKV